MKKLNNFIQALDIITEYAENSDRNIIIAIDGRCASGKTTFSEYLKKHLDCNVIHLDDFFLQPHQRTQERLDKPGGNVDIERFKEEVMGGIFSGKDYSFRPFDCKVMSLSKPVSVKAKRLTLIEGSYSQHPEIAEYYDLKFFITTTPEKQKERIIQRNKEKADMFFSKWIPLEEKYFEAFSIEQACDFIIST